MPSGRILVVVNSRSTRASVDLSAAFDVLRGAAAEVEVLRIGEPEDLARSLAEAARGFDAVVVGGGDGTMASAAGTLIRAGLPVGILPLGNACDLARSLGIPRDPAAACRIVAGGATRRLDVGRVNGHHFFNVASLGLSVGVAQRLTGELKRRWRVLGYPLLVRDALRAAAAFRVEIDCDGTRHRLRTIQLGVGNGRFQGGGLLVAADARLDDGVFHVYSIAPLRPLQLALVIPYFLTGRHTRLDYVTVMMGRRIVVETSRPRSINADGEIVTRTPAVFEVLEGALEVFVAPGRRLPGLAP